MEAITTRDEIIAEALTHIHNKYHKQITIFKGPMMLNHI